jgi:hypothetical protein
MGYSPPGQNNVIFRYLGNGVPSSSFLPWSDLTNTSELDVTCTYVTED